MNVKLCVIPPPPTIIPCTTPFLNCSSKFIYLPLIRQFNGLSLCQLLKQGGMWCTYNKLRIIYLVIRTCLAELLQPIVPHTTSELIANQHVLQFRCREASKAVLPCTQRQVRQAAYFIYMYLRAVSGIHCYVAGGTYTPLIWWSVQILQIWIRVIFCFRIRVHQWVYVSVDNTKLFYAPC